MFTVILLSDSAKEILNGARDYFKPFEEKGLLTFCDWVESDKNARSDGKHQTLYDVLPDLAEAIRGKPRWRAIVVDHVRGVAAEQGRDPENPFDFVANQSTALALEPSPYALVRLSHVLLGYPHLPAKDFRRLLLYKDEDGNEQELPTDQTWSGATVEVDDGGSARFEERVHFEEVPYEQEELEKHRALVDLYRMKEVHPSEVIFVATRDTVHADDSEALSRAWQIQDELTGSRFVERNDYPPKSRFAVYDLLEEENSGYEKDLLTFWLGILTLSTNQLPTSSFQAERLYRLEVETSGKELAHMLNKHISVLVTVRDFLDRRIHHAGRTYALEVADLLTPVSVRVPFDDLGGNNLGITDRPKGLSRDYPTNETTWWEGQTRNLEREVDTFMKKPRRAVQRSVGEARAKMGANGEPEEMIDEITLDELEEELDNRLEDLVTPTTADLLDKRDFKQTIEAGTSSIRSHIAQRATLGSIGMVAAAVGIAWLVVFLPYLFTAWGRGSAALGGSGLTILIIVVTLVIAGLATLYFMRWRLLKMIEGMNQAILHKAAQVGAAGDAFASFLSAVATYSRGRELVRGTELALANQREQIRQDEILQRRIVAEIDQEKEVVRSSGTALKVVLDHGYITSFDPSNPRDVENLFRYPVTAHEIPFGNTGEYIVAPYEFIRELALLHLPVWEKQEEKTK